ncbi:MAG: MFS transporter [Puniceicoccales bacterium]|jgi:MFS family permease|nr:MFS transporter [Puniceicoccales bacterium]
MSIAGHNTAICPFTEPLIASLPISRIDFSNILFWATLVGTFLVPFFGHLFDRLGARRSITYSGLAMGLTLLFLAQITTLTSFFQNVTSPRLAILSFLFIGFFFLKLLGQNLIPLVTRMMILYWYDHRSCTMIGLSGVFISISFGVAPQCIQFLMERFGYTAVWTIEGLITLFFLVPIIWATCRDSPHMLGMSLDSHTPQQQNTSSSAKPVQGKTLKQALNSYDFWIFVFAMAYSMFLTAGFQIHIVDIFREAGACTSFAIKIFLPTAIISGSLSALLSVFLDKVAIHFILVIIFLIDAFMMGSLEHVASPYGRYMFILSYGSNLAFYGILASAPWAKLFGRKHMGQIMAVAASISLILSGMAPSFLAYSRHLGSYFFATRILLYLSLLGFVVALFYVHAKGRKITSNQR